MSVPMITPHPHQIQALVAIKNSLQQGQHPLASLPTGSGKSYIAAWLTEELAQQNKVLIATHRKELIEQDLKALQTIGFNDFSVYSASLDSKDLTGQVVFAQIQSLHRLNGRLPKFGFIVIDEAHLIPRSSDSMYQQLFEKVPDAQRIGLTATPYRLDSGLLHEGEGAMFNDLCIQIPVKQLIPQFLSPLVGISALNEIETEGIKIQRGDYITSELEQIVCEEDLVMTTVSEMLKYMRQHVLIFATSIKHAQMIETELKIYNIKCAVITGATKKENREAYIEQFKNGELRVLINVNVLTTGFDAPQIDTIVYMRPTASKGLFVQMQGRGMRLAEDKENCLILDFAGNMIRHGALDELDSYDDKNKERREKREMEAREAQKRKLYLATEADRWTDPLLWNEMHELTVKNITYWTIPSKKQPDRRNIVVTYDCGHSKIKRWLCPEYNGGASWHAHKFLEARGYHGSRITDAKKFIQIAKYYQPPKSISVRRQGKYFDIKIEHFEE